LNHKNICTVSVSTGEIKQLTHNVESDLILDYPSWSPDGKKAYYSISRKTGDIYTLENY
jgi:Tol biopolymer transport system component